MVAGGQPVLIERRIDIDLRHPQDAVCAKNVAYPIVTNTLEHGPAHYVLGQKDIAADGRGCRIFAILDDRVGTHFAWTEHLENHDRIASELVAGRSFRASHESVGIADTVSHLDLQVIADEPAGFAAQTGLERNRKISLNFGMGSRAAGHCDRLHAIILVAKLLPVFPFQELIASHVPK